MLTSLPTGEREKGLLPFINKYPYCSGLFLEIKMHEAPTVRLALSTAKHCLDRYLYSLLHILFSYSCRDSVHVGYSHYNT